MSDANEDLVHDVVERLEWDENKDEHKYAHGESKETKWHQVTRRAALTGGAAGVVGMMLQACGSSSSSSSTASAASSSSSSAASSIFGFSTAQHYTMVNHVTTNVFFTPTQNGAADACKLLGCSYTWTGSATSNVGEMVNSINSAVSSKANGIATTLISPTAFNTPVKQALAAKIPVVAYNADEPQTGRLSYIGQDLLVSGQEMGQHIVQLLPNGGEIALFIATPGAANIQPRIDGAKDTLKSSPEHQVRRRRDRRRGACRADRDQLLGPVSLERQGHVRGRRGQHPGRRPDDPEAGPQAEGLGRRRL